MSNCQKDQHHDLNVMTRWLWKATFGYLLPDPCCACTGWTTHVHNHRIKANMALAARSPRRWKLLPVLLLLVPSAQAVELRWVIYIEEIIFGIWHLANHRFDCAKVKLWNQEKSLHNTCHPNIAAMATSAGITLMRRRMPCSTSGLRSSPTLLPSTPLASRCREGNFLYCRSPMELLGREICDDQCSSGSK